MHRRVSLRGVNGLLVEDVVHRDPTALEKRCIPVTQTAENSDKTWRNCSWCHK